VKPTSKEVGHPAVPSGPARCRRLSKVFDISTYVPLRLPRSVVKDDFARNDVEFIDAVFMFRRVLSPPKVGL
jgi:hypothetical protein